MEHARWFHHCAYVIKVKGQDFVDLVRLWAEHQQLEEVICIEMGTNSVCNNNVSVIKCNRSFISTL